MTAKLEPCDFADPIIVETVLVLKKIGGTSHTHGGKESHKELSDIAGKRVPLYDVPDLDAARSRLHGEFPYAAQAVDVLLADLFGREGVKFRPTLLLGAAGAGKTRLIRRLAEVLGMQVARYDAASSNDASFGGSARHWSTGEPCFALNAIRMSGYANPLVHVDEIDKATASQSNGALVNAILPLLESETAAHYPDPYVQADVDLSHVSVLLTANEDTGLPAPLRDRLRIVRISNPTFEHLPALTRSIVADVARERGGDQRFFPPLDDGEFLIAEELWAGGSVRRLRAIIERILTYRERNARH